MLAENLVSKHAFESWLAPFLSRFTTTRKESHVRFAECSGLRVQLDGIGDEKVTVESNPSFALQPFTLWPGLQEQVEAAYMEELGRNQMLNMSQVRVGKTGP